MVATAYMDEAERFDWLMAMNAGKILDTGPPAEVKRKTSSSTLEEAVEMAAGTARAGEAVLLSPACASFDMFRDYKHRGDVFAEAVRRLK